MTTILIYKGKHEHVYWDASTPAKQRDAMRAMFEHMRDDWDMYADLTEDLGWDQTPSKQRVMFQQAEAGDDVSLQRLLNARKSYEYEGWSLRDVLDPTPKEKVGSKK